MEILYRWELFYRWRTGAGETRRLERGRNMDIGHGCERSQWQSQALNPRSRPIASLLIFLSHPFRRHIIIFTPFSHVSKKIKCWRLKNLILHARHTFFRHLANFKELCNGFQSDALEQTRGLPMVRAPWGSTRKVNASKVKELLLLFPAGQWHLLAH